jgi:glycosyltransferase involved in cell wall biosynthesis
MKAPHVTVLTAVRNGAPYLAETVASIQNQSFTDWEYIIVDDASDDGTPQIAEDLARGDARIRVLVRSASVGPYAAANDGLRVARGAFTIRTDADDLSTPDRIEKQLAFLAAHPEYRACVSYWQSLNDQGVMPSTQTPIPLNSRVFRWSLLLRSQSIHSAVCFETAMMRELGGYRELPLSQDYRLWCDLTRRGWLGTIPEVLCYVRSHGKRQSHTSYTVQRELAIDVLSDHLAALTGERWSREDLLALRSVGHGEVMPVHKGLEMLDRWDRLWQAADDLTPADRAELARTSSFRRWKHLRANARQQPLAALKGAMKSIMLKGPQSLVPAGRGASL